MVISVIPASEFFEKKVLYIPPTVSWEIDMRREIIELDDELGDYRSYGLYLKSTDGVNSCIFHSELIEREAEALRAEDEDVLWLFEELLSEIFQQVAKALAEKSEKVELGQIIDRCMNDWAFHIACERKANKTE